MISIGQPGMDSRSASSERWRMLLQSDMRNLDSASFVARYQRLAATAAAEKDYKSAWVLDFLRFKNRRTLNLSREQKYALLADLEKRAIEEDWPIETLVTRHYAQFERFNAKEIPLEQLFAHLLNEFSGMQEVGFEQFRDYDLTDLMFHSGQFMFNLEDHDNALRFLLVGEQFMDERKTGYPTVVLTLNYIQSIYLQQQDTTQSIEYVQKILRATDSIQLHQPKAVEFCRYWKGLATIDMASILLAQRKFIEGEKFANAGYALITSAPTGGPEADLEAELTALFPLISIQLELNKTEQAETMLRRADSIWAIVGHKEFNYFKQIRLWEAHARVAETQGDFAACMRYIQLVNPLRDSLKRLTDGRKLAKIEQRLEAQRYVEKIMEVEREQRFQARLMYAALLGLLGLGLFTWWNYRRLQHKRRRDEVELEAYNQFQLEKTAAEVSPQASGISPDLDLRSRYLQELRQSTILTEQDWVQFRMKFEKVYPNFIEEQNKIYANITPAEMRYLTLQKLQLSTREMAGMLGVSDGTIRQTRFRLLKKQL